MLLTAGLVAAILPWFHVKNIAPAAILTCAALFLDARRDRLTLKRSLEHSVHFDVYGGFAIGGRFMWTGAALWFVPIVLFYRDLAARGRRVVWICCAASLAWQVILMSHWVQGGTAPLLKALSSNLLERNSYFPGAIRHWFPSFYDAQNWFSHPQNLWWMAVSGGLVILGVGIGRRRATDG